MSILRSKYYDHPEGEDAFGKTVATNKYAVAAGLAWSTVDVLTLAKPKGYLPTLGRFAYNTGPLMGMATAFTLTTLAATNARGKDDKINYLLGGFAAGGVFGAWKHNHVAGLCAGLFLGIAGVIKKMSIEQGWEFFPDTPTKQYGGLNIAQNDWTIMADRPKGWTSEKQS
ncbi:NADH dehydrogenase [ubiquinone] 1 alpha subcomplex subunit 11 [Drosophila pseudoobscura]|uniref:NADH dehydrogenase [ubiquinone] 1 alpha subcomplex subunit 11 n=1 Tax=Drosophila pseudoobscura pseudoobscura TaxID=46245 RepID=A0A6I8VRV0_DROPS|nr:NADH dehydrogenase [ubiquinone] 1 alpha subcomplex subunit 11 [Drosophila pseudoobscura]XP_033233790.1 NADH dehydrogenase [ubiquinone] 1 alpha subcomplex subunit 11 [Drosophila pseudoobscura]